MLKNNLGFVNIIPLKSDNCALTMRKRLYCAAKPTVLPCKTAAFRMQNNRFCKALIVRLLRNGYACEKYLHLYYLLLVHKKREFGVKITLVGRLATVCERLFGSTSFTFAEHQNKHSGNDKHKANNDRKRKRFAEKKYAHAHSCHRFKSEAKRS